MTAQPTDGTGNAQATPDRGRLSRQQVGWLVAGLAGIVLLAVALWVCVAVVPYRLHPPLTADELQSLPSQQAILQAQDARRQLQNAARTSLLQALAALLVLGGASIGATVALQQVRVGREQLKQARQEAQKSDERTREQLELARQQAQDTAWQVREQLAVAREGQITERLTRAIDQLGETAKPEITLGGIYALERIAHDSERDQAAIAEILATYVRQHAPWPPPADQPGAAAQPPRDLLRLRDRLPRVQAAVTVLARMPRPRDEQHRLDLRRTDLRRVDLREAHLEYTRLEEAHLDWAWLLDAHLEHAWLRAAHLRGVQLPGTHLDGADLQEAGLDGATLQKARLVDADLRGARADAETRWPDDFDQAHRATAGIIEPDVAPSAPAESTRSAEASAAEPSTFPAEAERP